MKPELRYSVFLLLLSLFMITGCANVHYEHGRTDLTGKQLVFGKITLVRDGEAGTISTFSTPVTIGPLESTDEPLLITEPLDRDGRFYWLLKPGRQVLNIVLHEPSDDIVTLAFDVPDKPGAYYFGDLTLSGEKHFSALGAANVRHVTTSILDNFAAEETALLARNPSLSGSDVSRLAVVDISKNQARAAWFRAVLDAAPHCCNDMSAFHYAPLVAGKTTAVEITRGQGTFAFPDGRSYFRAFELPRYSAPYAIELRSQVMPSGIPFHFRVFAPAALLLDRNFQVLDSFGPQGLRVSPARLLPPRAASLDETLRITTRNAQARYLVLYTTDSLLSQSRLTSVPGVFLIPGGALPSGMPQPAAMTPWPTGKVELTVASGQQ